jgi:threonine dehydrogenase-like Zn-dependent dehydrogenase
LLRSASLAIRRRFVFVFFASIVSSSFASVDLPKTMKGIVAHEYGGPEVLKYEDVPLPEPKNNEILVRVIASGVNPADPLILNGKYAKEFGTHLPLILGYDMAGVVVKMGANVTKLKVGDPVYAFSSGGVAGPNIASRMKRNRRSNRSR